MCGITRSVAHLTVPTCFTIHWDEGKPRPYNPNVLILGDRNSDTFSAPVVGCRRRNRPAVGCPPYVADTFSAPTVGAISKRFAG
ncbi:MAG: hypothetical protein LBQ66_03430 [Planctomycetaceae bacterium]|nr:hypothetical protein [Planctomycetaceae bacterium]